jgi:hypothetical protein
VSGFTVKLLTGLAELLESAGVGSWDAAAVPDGSDVAITLVNLPQSPTKVVCLTSYPVMQSARATEGIVGVNVRVRGDTDPRTASDIADEVFGALGARGRTAIGTAPNDLVVAAIDWQSSAPLGPDANGRHEISANYYVRVNRAHDRLE